jgi:hyaluronan synthase
MYTAGLQVYELFITGVLHLFLIFYLFIIGRWLIYKAFASKYRPFVTSFTPTVSILIPVADEDADLFRNVLSKITEAVKNYPNAATITVIINGKRNEKLEKICQDFADINWYWTKVPGKRNALAEGIVLAKEKHQAKVVVLVDSDTLWTENTLLELVKPFAEPKVGGVTTQQRIFDAQRSFYTRFSDWIEYLRNHLGLRFLSYFGQIGCLPGRTIAFRTEIVYSALPHFVNERFLGKKVEFSDDRSLTYYTLKAGFQTVYQESSQVYTDAPENFDKFFKQQTRWARGSQLNNLKQWQLLLLEKPLLGFFFYSEMLIPFFILYFYSITLFAILDLRPRLSVASPDYDWLFFVHVFLIFLGILLSFLLRNYQFFRQEIFDLKLFFKHVLVLITVMPFIRLYALMSMAERNIWGTRNVQSIQSGGFNIKSFFSLSKIPYVIVSCLVFFVFFVSLQ